MWLLSTSWHLLKFFVYLPGGTDTAHYNDFDPQNANPQKIEPANAITILNSVLLRKPVVSKLSRYDLLLGVAKAEAYFAFNGEDVQVSSKTFYTVIGHSSRDT